MTNVQPYEWVTTKKDDLTAKISCVTPAGGMTNYASYELTFDDGAKVVLRDNVFDKLFKTMGILGTRYETLEETQARLAPEEEDLKTIAKELGIKGAHLMSEETLRNKIAEKGES